MCCFPLTCVDVVPVTQIMIHVKIELHSCCVEAIWNALSIPTNLQARYVTEARF